MNCHSSYFKIHLFLFVCGMGLLSSCTTHKHALTFILNSKKYCTPFNATAYLNIPISPNSDSVLATTNPLSKYFSERSLLLIHALHLNDELIQLSNTIVNPSLDNRVTLLEYKRKIMDRVDLARADIDAVVSELDCMQERMHQAITYIDTKTSSTINKLTVASIVLGATASILGAVIIDNDWNNGATIAAGIAGAGLGFATLKINGGIKTIRVVHERNFLRDIWTKDNSLSAFPPIVWFMMSEKRISASQEFSLIDMERKMWLAYNFLDNEKLANSSVIFSTGGYYNLSKLRTASNMINQLKSVVGSLDRHLSFLLLEIDKTIF